MRALLTFVPGLVLLAITIGCARSRTAAGLVEERGTFRCDGLTVATVTNESDAAYHVVVRSGLKELRLGTAAVGETRFSTTEPVSELYLVAIVDDQPIAGRAPGNSRPARVVPKGRVDLQRACL